MAFGDFTFARAGTKWALNSAGVLAEVAANVPAFEFNADGTYRGLLVEPAATNQIRNNSMQGAVVGTPGTLPTNWAENLSGLTRSVVGTGTENGVDYIDIRLHGTSSGTSADIRFETATGIVAANGQTWTLSAWVKTISTSLPPTQYALSIQERTAAGGFLAAGTTQLTPTTTLARHSFARTLSGGVTVERVQPAIGFTLVNGATYDFTIRIGLPQMELGSVATSVIKTTGAAASRVADSVSLTGASSLIGQTEGYIAGAFEIRASGTDRTIYTAYEDANNHITLRLNTSNQLVGEVVAGGVTQATFTSAALTAGTKYAAVLSYSAGATLLSLNGVQVGATDTSATIPATSNLRPGISRNGDQRLNGWLRVVANGEAALSLSDANALTTAIAAL